MSNQSRGDRIQLLQKVLKKYFKPVAPVEGRSVLEQIVFACCLEDSRFEAAEEAFLRLKELYYDWNEIRVTTVTELADALRALTNPSAAALRVKRNLQSIFESRYSFDLEELRKMNQGKAIQELEKLSGISRFVLGYLVQNTLGGHTIPISDSINQILLMTGIVTQSEADKQQAPGLDRSIPKTKGVEFSTTLHQFAAEYAIQPQNKQIKAILKEAGGVELPKPEPVKAVPPKVEKKDPSAAKVDPKKPDPKKPDPKHAEAKKAEAHKPDAKKPDPKKPEPKALEPKKPELKKTEPKKAETKKPEGKKAEAAPAKHDAKKPEVKKPDTKKPVDKPIASKKSLPAKNPTPAAKPIVRKPVLPVAKKLTKRKPK
ncbi:MAG: hypothetical protein U0892_12975 [Pirellulales bacterium]